MRCMEYCIHFPSGVKKGEGTYPKCNSAVWAQIYSWNGEKIHISLSSLPSLLPVAIIMDSFLNYRKSSCIVQLSHDPNQRAFLLCVSFQTDWVVPKHNYPLKHCITICIKLNILLENYSTVTVLPRGFHSLKQHCETVSVSKGGAVN